MSTLRISLPRDPASVGEARHQLSRFADDNDLGDNETMLLVVSELVTNAVLHGADPIEVCVSSRVPERPHRGHRSRSGHVRGCDPRPPTRPPRRLGARDRRRVRRGGGALWGTATPRPSGPSSIGMIPTPTRPPARCAEPDPGDLTPAPARRCARLRRRYRARRRATPWRDRDTTSTRSARRRRARRAAGRGTSGRPPRSRHSRCWAKMSCEPGTEEHDVEGEHRRFRLRSEAGRSRGRSSSSWLGVIVREPRLEERPCVQQREREPGQHDAGPEQLRDRVTEDVDAPRREDTRSAPSSQPMYQSGCAAVLTAPVR